MNRARIDLVKAYWRHHRLIRGDRAERLRSAEDFWAWEAVSAAVTEGADSLLALFDDLLAADDADPYLLGAGPIEDLLHEHPARFAADIAERCQRNPRWRQAVGCVDLDATARSAALPDLAGYLPRR